MNGGGAQSRRTPISWWWLQTTTTTKGEARPPLWKPLVWDSATTAKGGGFRLVKVYETLSEIARLIENFENCTLPCHEWTHQAHLIVGLWHCSKYDAVTATDLLRDRIKRYNLACGKQNTETSGYHETITRFFVWYIKKYLDGVEANRSLVELVNEFCARHGNSDLPLKYYSQECLMSVEARRGWVEPDLKLLV